MPRLSRADSRLITARRSDFTKNHEPLQRQSNMRHSIHPQPSRRQAFTLVELLVVIAIIGILSTLAVTAAMRALTTAKQAAIRTEIDVLGQSLEAYKLEYGDYPPDFSNWNSVEQHFRKAFPNIDDRELLTLAQFTHYSADPAPAIPTRINAETSGLADPRVRADYDHYPHAIDRAESLVFCLGGYSGDKKHPFTGQGGPLALISGATLPAAPSYTDFLLYQYNSEREIGQFPFDIQKLNVKVYDGSPNPLAASVPFAYSRDEGSDGPAATNTLGFALYPDPFPVYTPSGKSMPFVYFPSSSFSFAFGATTAAVWNGGTRNHHWQAVYLPAGGGADTGICRPYASNTVDTTPPATIQGFTVLTGGRVLEPAAKSSYQIISAGLDDHYGGIAGPGVGAASPGICVYPMGTYYNPFVAFAPAGSYTTISSVNKYQDNDAFITYYGGAAAYTTQPQLDNITNFSSSTLESDLP